MKTSKRIQAVLALALIITLVVPWTAFAWVGTPYEGYSPGDIVTIQGDNRDGAGYIAGETVYVDVTGPNGYTASCEGVADGNGAWACDIRLWSDSRAVGQYFYTAAGQNVSQTGTFTDGNVTVTGSVKDTSGNAIVGATVSCTTSSGCNANLSTTTNASGNYYFDGKTGHDPSSHLLAMDPST